jgi:hypothetical protein
MTGVNILSIFPLDHLKLTELGSKLMTSDFGIMLNYNLFQRLNLIEGDEFIHLINTLTKNCMTHPS